MSTSEMVKIIEVVGAVILAVASVVKAHEQKNESCR